MDLRELLCDHLEERGFEIKRKDATVNHLVPDSKPGDYWTIWVERPDEDARSWAIGLDGMLNWKFVGSEVEIAVGRLPENATTVVIGDRKNPETITTFQVEDPRSLSKIVEKIDEVRKNQLIRDKKNLSDCINGLASRYTRLE